MKSLLLIIFGLLLALIEIIARFSLGGISIQLSALGLVALTLLLAGSWRAGAIILLSGSLVLDMFSPFRFGFYLLQASMVLVYVNIIRNRSYEFDNPIVMSLSLVLGLAILNVLELLADPIIIVFIVNILANSLLGLVVSRLVLSFSSTDSNIVKVSDNVRFR